MKKTVKTFLQTIVGTIVLSVFNTLSIVFGLLDNRNIMALTFVTVLLLGLIGWFRWSYETDREKLDEDKNRLLDQITEDKNRLLDQITEDKKQLLAINNSLSKRIEHLEHLLQKDLNTIPPKELTDNVEYRFQEFIRTTTNLCKEQEEQINFLKTHNIAKLEADLDGGLDQNPANVRTLIYRMGNLIRLCLELKHQEEPSDEETSGLMKLFDTRLLACRPDFSMEYEILRRQYLP